MTDQEAMRLAIELAEGGQGFVSPNPLVGCVILDAERQVIGRGFHRKVGGPHAEIEALNSVTDQKRLDGAHAFVTLEPCAHYGRTPPCADKFASLPLASVTYGLLDPNPRVAGKGVEKIRSAGIQIRQIENMEDDLEDLAEIFLTNMRCARAFVTLKAATSLDGQMAMRSGESKWITSGEARAKTQLLRGYADAVLIGVNTFLFDDPSLNARVARFEGKESKVVLIDPQGRSLAQLNESNLLKVREPKSLFLVTKPGIKAPDGVQHIETSDFSWEFLTKELFRRGVCSILIEGGAYVYSQALREKCVDRLALFVAPKIIGAGGGLAWTRDLIFPQLADASSLGRVKTQSLGPDLFITGRLKV